MVPGYRNHMSLKGIFALLVSFCRTGIGGSSSRVAGYDRLKGIKCKGPSLSFFENDLFYMKSFYGTRKSVHGFWNVVKVAAGWRSEISEIAFSLCVFFSSLPRPHIQLVNPTCHQPPRLRTPFLFCLGSPR